MFDFLKTILTLTIASASLSLTMNFVPTPAFAQDEHRPPFIESKCDAQMVAEHASTMTKAQYDEVVDVVQEMGGITAEYAKILHDLITEYHQITPAEVSAWVKKNCGDVTIKHNGPRV
jgi:hypothetical protein